MDELPLAILSNILSRVSSQSLLRFRCVCMGWREAIDDSYFRNSLHCSKEQVLLHHGYEEKGIYLLKMQERATTKMIQIAKFPGLKGYMLLGACNGFLFFGHWTNVKNNPELLINPLTKEILRLPRAPDLQPTMSVYGFGFDRSANTCKMVQMEKNYYDEETRTHSIGARVYDFEKWSWRTCKAPPLSEWPCYKFVFASGALNWLLADTTAVLSFDLFNEEFSLIPILDDFDGVTQMHELGGSLALFSYRSMTHLEVWVLKDSTGGGWIRKYRIDPDRYYYAIGVISQYKRDELIFGDDERDIYSYNVGKKRFTRRGRCNHSLPYFASATLSLVSLERFFG